MRQRIVQAAIGQREFLPGFDRSAQSCHMRKTPCGIGKRIDSELPRIRLRHGLCGQNRIDLVGKCQRGTFQIGVRSFGHDGDAQVQCFQFFGRKGEWLQSDCFAHHISHTAFPFDGYARGHKRVHVAVDRADRHFQPVRNILRPVQFAVAQDLNDVEKAVGTAHITPFAS